MANHTEGLPVAFYMSCFISGMKDAIQSEVKMFFPNTMIESLVLDNFTEDRIMAPQRSKSTFVPLRNMVPQRPQIPPPPRNTPIKYFSEVEMQAHREKWICYNCDEKFTWGH